MRSTKLRLMQIPRAGNRRYLGFLELRFDSAVRLQSGDRLEINFNPTVNDGLRNWNAQVIDPIPFAPYHHVCVFVTRPWVKEVSSWAADPTTENDEDFHAIDTTQFATNADLRTAIASDHGMTVYAKAIRSNMPYRLALNALRCLLLEIRLQSACGETNQGHPARPTCDRVNEMKCSVEVDLWFSDRTVSPVCRWRISSSSFPFRKPPQDEFQ